MPNLIYSLPPIISVPPRPTPEPSGALAVQPCLARIPAVAGLSISLPVPLPVKPGARPAPKQLARCSVKGCVFPASSPQHPQCHYHELQRSEGALFQSHQPSYLLTLHVPLGVPDSELDDSRYRDRRQQAAEREAFLLDEPGEMDS